ncbi:MAG: hypothetical protein KGQ42_02365, partial [Alphaproteobacteria bacterium]|nr:hypothetical protein [Alphaproteobacteria bacterium]
ISIDCTPVEARSFLGLPDMTPIHEEYIGKMREMFANGSNMDMLDAMTKSWGPMTELNTRIIQTMMGGRKS